jgi:hypothetical protein
VSIKSIASPLSSQGFKKVADQSEAGSLEPKGSQKVADQTKPVLEPEGFRESSRWSKRSVDHR